MPASSVPIPVIGGSSYNPCSADFVPPPPEAVARLLDDLLAFCNDAWRTSKVCRNDA